MVLIYGIFISCTGNEIASEIDPDGIYAQDRIYGKVSDLPGRRVLLFELYGDRTSLIDSVVAGPDGSFEFHFPPSREKGLYRVAMGKPGSPGSYGQHSRQFDLIWDGTAVVFTTSYTAPVDSMKIILSEENRHYYQLIRTMDDYHRKISVLSSSLIHYPSDDNFYRRLERQYKRVQNRRSNYLDNLTRRNEGAIYASIASFYKMPRLVSPAGEGNLRERREDFFSPGQFSDPVLLRTDLIPGKITRYLSLWKEAGLSTEDRQEQMITAVDVIMEHAMENEKIYYYVLEYLLNGFAETAEMDVVTEHLSGRYLHGNVCFEEGRLLDSDPSSAWKPEKGATAPGFRFTALDGRTVSLHGLEAEYTIVLFWGSWCPHCSDVMEGLFDLYTRYHEKKPGFLEVVAIGIEDDVHEWRNFIEAHGYNWVNYSSFNKWDCQIARDYNLAGTPTMMLLDREKKFVQEPLRIRPLERFLSGRL